LEGPQVASVDTGAFGIAGQVSEGTDGVDGGVVVLGVTAVVVFITGGLVVVGTVTGLSAEHPVHWN